MGKADVETKLAHALSMIATDDVKDIILDIAGEPKEPTEIRHELECVDGKVVSVPCTVVRKGSFVGEPWDARKVFVLVGAHRSGFYQQERITVEETHRKEWMMHPRRNNKLVQRTIVIPEHTEPFGEAELKRSSVQRGIWIDIASIWLGAQQGWGLLYRPHVKAEVEQGYRQRTKLPENVIVIPWDQVQALLNGESWTPPLADGFAQARKDCYALAKRMGKGSRAIAQMTEILNRAKVDPTEAQDFLDRMIESED